MKREDFKDITKEHLYVCKEIIENNGCSNIPCDICPFSCNNSANNFMCSSSNHEQRVIKAREFLESFKNYLSIIFSDAKVGDRAWSFEYGWGTITHVFYENEYPIIFKSDTNKICNFRVDGKRDINDINPSLFWNEIKIEIPEKPFDLEDELKKLEIKEFVFNEPNYFLTWCCSFECIEYEYSGDYQNPYINYFTEKSIKDFMKNIKYKKITKKQFFTAYKNVFRNKI